MLNYLMIAAQVATVAPAPAGVATVQQAFETASALSEKKQDAAALAAWEALERRVVNKPRSLAIVRVRKSETLLALNRQDEAVAAARAGLAVLPADDQSLKEDRYKAYLSLGRIAEATLDYASAAETYRQAAVNAPTPDHALAALRGAIEAGTFVDPDRATADMTRAELLAESLSIDAKSLAILKRVKSQLLLNQGKFAATKVEAGAAVNLLGGLTARTDLYDVAARSNYAIAALLNGDPDEARKYMAFTGAGRLSVGSFDPGTQMKVPDCGGEAGLKPEDVAVIEFFIGDDGTVMSSTPVYAAGGGAVALEFARTVKGWWFDPLKMKGMPLFFRYRTRVELRCSTGFERPSIRTYLDTELGVWLAAKGASLPPLATGSDAAVLPALRAQLARIEAAGGRDAIDVVPTLHALVGNVVVGREERNALARRELAILVTNGAPPSVRLAAEYAVWETQSADWNAARNYVRTASAAVAGPAYAADPAARAVVRLILADALRSKTAQARELLQQVAADTELAGNHPLRVGALIRLASLEEADGKVEAARAAFESSGLSARQCALIDAPPRFLGAGGTFPQEAMSWGFEGWTQVQFDVGADGKVLNERAIVSYPPFVFTKAGTSTLRSAKFEKSFRPDGGLSCGGTSQSVRFVMTR